MEGLWWRTKPPVVQGLLPLSLVWAENLDLAQFVEELEEWPGEGLLVHGLTRYALIIIRRVVRCDITSQCLMLQ